MQEGWVYNKPIPRLNKYFCIYIDILGYSNRLINKKSSELQNELSYFLKYVIPENKLLENLSRITKYYIKSFSDNIFIALQINKKTRENLSLILSHIIDYQKTLIQGNYFIRGGISLDKLYVDKKENIIWGSALIKAVKIEKETKFPFIGISNDILKLFKVSNINKFLDIPLVKVINNHYCLDYLKTIIHYNGKPEIGFLKNHKRFIESNIKNNIDDCILGKYVLLAKYHNKFCNDNVDKFRALKKYLINDCIFTKVKFEQKYLRIIET